MWSEVQFVHILFVVLTVSGLSSESLIVFASIVCYGMQHVFMQNYDSKCYLIILMKSYLVYQYLLVWNPILCFVWFFLISCMFLCECYSVFVLCMLWVLKEIYFWELSHPSLIFFIWYLLIWTKFSLFPFFLSFNFQFWFRYLQACQTIQLQYRYIPSTFFISISTLTCDLWLDLLCQPSQV